MTAKQIAAMTIVTMLFFVLLSTSLAYKKEAIQLQTELDKVRDEVAKLNYSLFVVLDQTDALQRTITDDAREIRKLRAIISCLAMEDTIDLEEKIDGTFVLKSSVYPHVEFPPDYDPLGGL